MSRLLIMTCLALSGCGAPTPQVSLFVEPPLVATNAGYWEPVRPGTCRHREETPGVIEIAAQNGPYGTAHRTETSHGIVRPRRIQSFETPCPSTWTPQFIASVQMALMVRGLMPGPPNGMMDTRTRTAIRAFQRQEGIDSDVLSTAAGKRLGLIVYDPSEVIIR